MYEEMDSGVVGCRICWISMRRGGIDNEHHNKNVNHISICYLEYVRGKNVLKIVNPSAQSQDELMDVETCSCTNLKFVSLYCKSEDISAPQSLLHSRIVASNCFHWMSLICSDEKSHKKIDFTLMPVWELNRKQMPGLGHC